MKRSELAISTALVPLDALAIFGAFLLSYYVRVETTALPVADVIPFDRYLKLSAAITVVWLVIFALFGLYKLRSTRRGLNEFGRLLGAVSVGSLIVVALIFFGDIEYFSRFVILFGFLASLILVTLERGIVRFAQHRLFRYGIGVRRAVIVGTGRTARVLAKALATSHRGYVILGFVETGQGKPKPNVIGRLSDVPKLLKRLSPDEIIDADPKLSDRQKRELIAVAEDVHVDFRFSSNVMELATSRVDVTAVAGIPLMTLKPTPLEGWGRVLKRMFDVIGALLVLPFLLILYPFIALAIKLNSPGPVLLPQKRVGKAGKLFNYHKFRSMTQWKTSAPPKELLRHNEASGPVFKMKDDPRVTRVGKFLRKTSLDELPQIFNVLKGDMSLVGPRPPLPHEVKEYTREQRRRLTVKPGMTGPWQVSGRSDISFDEWVRLDVYYIQNWSLLLDLTILLKTVGVVVTRKGAY